MHKERIGDAELYLGDCLEILPALGKVDAVVTDPPYQLTVRSSGRKQDHWADIHNAAFWFAELFRLFRRCLEGHGVVWQFLNWRTVPTLTKAALDAGWEINSLAVWDKEIIGTGSNRGLRKRYEMIALLIDGPGLSNRGVPDIFQARASYRKPSGHPAEKPVSIMRQIIGVTEGETILDPFMGSGTTAVACRELGRKFIGIEIDPQYFEIARSRIRAA